MSLKPLYSIPIKDEDVVRVVSIRRAILHSTPVGPIECTGRGCPLCFKGVSSRFRMVYRVISSKLDPSERDYVPPSYSEKHEDGYPSGPGLWRVIRLSALRYIWEKYDV